MPSVSRKQHALFEAVAHNPKIAKERKIDPKVAREFLRADAAAGKYQGKAKPDTSKQHPERQPMRNQHTASQEGITKQLASYSVGGLTDKPTQPPADRTYEFKTF